MVAEAYPDLKANANFTQLQASLEDTENKISYARQSYNDCVLNYKQRHQNTFPGNIFAGIFQFKQRSGFEGPQRRPARCRRSSSNDLQQTRPAPREPFGQRGFCVRTRPPNVTATLTEQSRHMRFAHTDTR